MRVDIRSLGTLNRMAHEGAERAASHLTAMTGIETFVSVTRTDIGGEANDGGDRVGVAIDLDGGLCGRTAFTFPRESAERVLDVLVPDSDGIDRSAARELGNVMAGGFVDGWADYLGTTIEISPPTYIDGDPVTGVRDEHTLTFDSTVEAVDETVEFAVHLAPEWGSLPDALSTGSDGTVSIEKLAAFDELTRRGATLVAESVTAMTGIETRVDITTLSFVPIETVPDDLCETTYVGVVFECEGPPSGYLIVLFDEGSAWDVVSALVPGDREADEFGEMDRSAVRELGNVMASSFVDGWANALDTTIDISPPQFVHDLGGAIVDPMVAQLGRRQEFAFVSDATIRADDRTFDCRMYALPNESELRDALADLEPDARGERRTGAGKL